MPAAFLLNAVLSGAVLVPLILTACHFVVKSNNHWPLRFLLPGCNLLCCSLLWLCDTLRTVRIANSKSFQIWDAALVWIVHLCLVVWKVCSITPFETTSNDYVVRFDEIHL